MNVGYGEAEDRNGPYGECGGTDEGEDSGEILLPMREAVEDSVPEGDYGYG